MQAQIKSPNTDTGKLHHKWWQSGIIYQIYPRSFNDSSGDGIGDLKGITRQLDYLAWLGVTAIWISPVYPSPMADFGYDISDYKQIDPLFGTLSDFDALLDEAHKRNMKVIMDLVPNHTSDQHPWFQDSKSSKASVLRDWYIWHDAKPDGSPPNNWLSVFGGSAWEWDERTEQYYYHAFLKEQPDLNWRNPDVQEAIFDVMRFWLDKGVDGFRVDVIWHLIKDKDLRDNPPNPDYVETTNPYQKLLPVYSTDQPEVHDIVAKLRTVIDEFTDRLLIGEIYLPIHQLVTYYGTDNQGAHLPFNFLLLGVPWDATSVASIIDEYEAALSEGSWPNWVLGNHDKPRLCSRIGRPQLGVAAVLLLTLRGTPTIYYGEEIGMEDVPIPANEVRDPQGRNNPGLNLNRDTARTPMQWDESRYAGFSTHKPWLRIMEKYESINVKVERGQPDSLLNLYRRLIELRQREPALHVGAYIPVHDQPGLLVYRRELYETRFLIVLNLNQRPVTYSEQNSKGTIMISTRGEMDGTKFEGEYNVHENEGIVVRLDPPSGV